MTRATLLFIALGASLGSSVGLGSYTFIYARGYSYLSNDPEVCANCHVMRGHFDGWAKGSHHAVAVCNDCHTPANPIGKYFTKGLNGFYHSYAFTTGNFPEPIQITARNRAVTEGACRTCHREMTVALEGAHAGAIECLRCHSTVGHQQ